MNNPGQRIQPRHNCAVPAKQFLKKTPDPFTPKCAKVGSVTPGMNASENGTVSGGADIRRVADHLKDGSPVFGEVTGRQSSE